MAMYVSFCDDACDSCPDAIWEELAVDVRVRYYPCHLKDICQRVFWKYRGELPYLTDDQRKQVALYAKLNGFSVDDFEYSYNASENADHVDAIFRFRTALDEQEKVARHMRTVQCFADEVIAGTHIAPPVPMKYPSDKDGIWESQDQHVERLKKTNPDKGRSDEQWKNRLRFCRRADQVLETGETESGIEYGRDKDGRIFRKGQNVNDPCEYFVPHPK